MALVEWSNRYSDTMENDSQGRWARIGHAGTGEIKDGGLSWFEVAWIDKIEFAGKQKFSVKANFPYKLERVYDDLEEAKNSVEKALEFFLNEMKKCQE